MCAGLLKDSGFLKDSGLRPSLVEYLACPSCVRTLLNVPEETKHITDLSIAVMDCVVNGTVEMYDVDYGYMHNCPRSLSRMDFIDTDDVLLVYMEADKVS